MARDFIEQGLRTPALYLRFPVFPQAADLLFAWGLLAGGATSAQFLSLLAWLLTATLLFLWGARDDSPRAGLWAACLWIGGQTARNAAVLAYVDSLLVLCTTGAAFCLWTWRAAAPSRSRTVLLWLTAALAGAGAATKYSGLLVVLLLAAGVAFWERPSARVRSTLRFLVVATAVASPWYVRSALLSGDPFFPALGPERFEPLLAEPDYTLYRIVAGARRLDAPALDPR